MNNFEHYLFILKLKILIVIFACVLLAVLIMNIKSRETRVIDEYGLLSIHPNHVSYLNANDVIEFLNIDKVSEFNLVYDTSETALKGFRSIQCIFIINPMNGENLFKVDLIESEKWSLYIVEEQLEFLELGDTND